VWRLGCISACKPQRDIAQASSSIRLSKYALTSGAVGFASTHFTHARGNKPARTSVLVLRPTRQLPGGHVAVVSSIVGAREIRVDHANWDDRRTRGRIYENMSVIDVSPRNDWTALRFWNGAGYGKIYAAYGFIHNQNVAVGTARQASR
jgi:hypothetical protein